MRNLLTPPRIFQRRRSVVGHSPDYLRMGPNECEDGIKIDRVARLEDWYVVRLVDQLGTWMKDPLVARPS